MESDITLQVPDTAKQCRRSRTLRRGVHITEFSTAEKRYVWAAYEMGVMTDVSLFFMPDLEQGESFETALHSWLSKFSACYVIGAPLKGKDEVAPVGFVPVRFFDPFTIIIEEFVWMPWATPRNKIEGALKFLCEIKKQSKGLHISKPETEDFLVHICRYGVMRRIGKLNDYGPRKRKPSMFETR